MKVKALKNATFFKSRNGNLLRLYKKAVGSPGAFVVIAVLVLEALCFAADLMAFSLLFGQVMGDAKGMVAAGAISLLFPLVAFFGFQGLSSRFQNRRKRERLAIALLTAMAVFLVAVLVIRFPLEAAAESDEGVDWLITALVYCLPPLSSVIGALAASLTLHNPQVRQKFEAARLRVKIANVKAELAVLEASDPPKFRAHIDNVYRAAYCEIDGLLKGSVAECIGLLVQRHGMGVHDHLSMAVDEALTGSGRYDTRPPTFARKADVASTPNMGSSISEQEVAPHVDGSLSWSAPLEAGAALGSEAVMPSRSAQQEWNPQVHMGNAGAKIA